MAPMRVFPPEAYTNRELAQAYAWLQTQPEHIQRLGSTAEALISLYKRAVRGGDPNVSDSVVSSETFRSDLRNLADGLKTFEAPPQPKPMPTPVPMPMPTVTKSDFEFDERSWKMIQMVKNELNLSHEMEAIRLLVKLGFEKVVSVLPSASI